MALSKGDDYPIHQTPEPVAYAGTDRNFYDRYFFNGYAMQGSTSFFAAAFGVYPHLNIADAAFVVVRNGVETALHASRCLEMERMDIVAGPIRIDVVEPLVKLRIRVDAPGRGIAADILFTGRIAPIEEPRFIRRIGPRTVMDYTRLTQNGRYQGWIELDGVRESIDGFVGTRDRSWGVRPVGARDPQAPAPKTSPQFFWLWSPTNFESASLFFHSNDDAAGVPWNRRAVWAADNKPAREFENAAASVVWAPGTRHAAQAVVKLDGGAFEATFTPIYNFFMLGLGYGHPKWAHGLNHGEDAVEREDIVLKTVDVRLPHHLHIQALCDVTCRDDEGRVHQGRGVLEQLVVGPHAPSGFKTAQDFCPMTSAGAAEPLGQQLERYLSRVWAEEVRVCDLARIPGGASRETYRFDAQVRGTSRGLILRRDPTGSLIDTDRQIEFLAYKSFHGLVPVPEPLLLETEGDLLERPFFIMSRVDGGKVASVMMADPYGAHAAAIGNELFSILGRIARSDPDTLPIGGCFAAPDPVCCWREALDAWQAVIERDDRHPQPIVRAAMRRLRRNPPKPAQRISVVHGDFRSGNFLHDGGGHILAVLDWEMAHLGDPLEDLAWCFDRLWNHFDDSGVAGTVSEADAIAIWERESGLKVDSAALAWWKLFSAVKGCAIWTTSAKEFVAGGNDLVLGFAGTYTARRHDRIMADLLEKLVEEGWS